MRRNYRTEGVCLRRLDYGESSQVAAFLTPDHGQVAVIARGIRRASKHGISRALDLGARYRITYVERPAASLHFLSESTMTDGFLGLRRHAERAACAYYAIELMRNLTTEDLGGIELYELLLRTLRNVARGKELGLSVLRLEIGGLKHYGACPNFGVCAECGKPLSREGRYIFSASHGGPLCQECGREIYDGPDRSSILVRGEQLEDLADLSCGLFVSENAKTFDPARIVEASQVLRFHIQYLLGKKLELWKYLHGRHLSKSIQAIRRAANL
ncbi:MAG: DNA repair protein RecO [Candidatus Brocadiia bacterium]